MIFIFLDIKLVRMTNKYTYIEDNSHAWDSFFFFNIKLKSDKTFDRSCTIKTFENDLYFFYIDNQC